MSGTEDGTEHRRPLLLESLEFQRKENFKMLEKQNNNKPKIPEERYLSAGARGGNASYEERANSWLAWV